MRLLTIDIETAPHEAYVWSLHDKNSIPLQRLKKEGETLCFAARFIGEKKMHFYSKNRHGREAMVEAAYELLDEADALVHYNGQKFDVPILQGDIATERLIRPSPFKQIDLYRVAVKNFKFASMRLDHVAKRFGLGGKEDTGGFELWPACLDGDEKAWRKMEKYNRYDVVLTERLYEKLLPWIDHPSRRLYDGVTGCPTCEAETLQKRGKAYTRAGEFQQWHCTTCGTYFRSGKRSRGVDIQQVAS